MIFRPMILELAKRWEWSIPRDGYMSNLFKLIRKETNVVIWMASIIQGKATMDRFEWLAAVERSDKIKFATWA